MTADKASARRFTGRHMLLAMIGFFGVIFVVNAIFIYHAVSTFSGFDTADAYRTGLRYNDRIALEERQLERGWQATLDLRRSDHRLSLRIADAAGQPVSGLVVEGTLRHPASEGLDRPIVLREVAPGLYAGEADVEPGQWVAALAARDGARAESPKLLVRQRLWIAP